MQKKKKAAAALSLGLLLGSATGISSVSALNASDVLNDTLDDLQNTLVDYIFIKNYISGNISLSENFKKHLDYNNDNTVNIMDANHAKQKIIQLMEEEPKPVTTPAVTTSAPIVTSAPSVTSTTPVTTSSVPFKIGDMVAVNGKAYAKADGTGNSITLNGTYEVSNILPAAEYKYNVQLKGLGWVSPSECKTTSVTSPVTTAPQVTSAPVTTVASEGNLKVGDIVSYNGKAYAKADGTGNSVSVNGKFEITNILPSSQYKYNIQLKNLGWVAYSDVADAKQPDTPQNYDSIKIGDTVQFTGKAYLTAGGAGSGVDISGRYEIINILAPNDTYKYTVQLKNTGWVSYKELTGKDQVNPAVTTAAPVTTVTTVTTASSQGSLKVGDTVSYKGKAYYSASGTGTNIDVNGFFKVKEILDNTNLPYTVQLEGAGWVAYKDVTGTPQQTTVPAVTTVTTITTTAPVTTPPQTTVTTSPAPQSGSLKVGDEVKYTGKAYYAASGAGKSVDVSGTFKVKEILTDQSLPYTVLLENAGWISYKDASGTPQQTTAPAVTTAPPVTTTQPQVTTAPQNQTTSLKVGDSVKYKGKAYYSASGNGTSVEVDGTFTVKEIVDASTGYPYTVQLERAGWVAYKDVAGTVQAPENNLDGNKYLLKNAASGRYLTVGGNDNRSNIYQDDRSNGNNQTFKAVKYSYSDSYRFFSDSATGKVIDIVKNSSSQVASGCNVQLYEAVDPDAQTWVIEEVSDGKYKIVSIKDNSLALTANGNTSGSSSGKDQTSEGNVFISSYSGSSSQLWYLEKVN